MRPLSWFKQLPLTIRVPVIVISLMVAISAAISERVLDRLAKTQESFLEELASSHVDAIAASILPSVLREDSWEIFDTLERMRPSKASILPVETVVATPSNIVLASDQPQRRETLTPLATEFLDQFTMSGFRMDGDKGLAYHTRKIDYQGQTIGTVFSLFDASPLLAERRQVLLALLLTNVALTMVLGLIGFVAVRRMIRPMQVLESHMIDAASGKSTPIGDEEMPRADQEARRMYRAFNAFVRVEQDRKRLSRQLAEEEKLASLGRVASGMAHEINNPLGGLMNAVDTLRRHGDKANVRSQSLDLIQRGLQGIGDVVQAALATYRPERLSRPFSARDIEDLKLLLGPELRQKNQRIETVCADNIAGPEASVPAGPVRQAILNLLLNAAAATPEGGTIRLIAERMDGELRIAVLDEGGGMPAEARTMLTGLDPRGSAPSTKGLGLWVVRQVADELGAAITVTRLIPAGTRIEFRVPLTLEQELTDAA